ncbi:MAG: arginine deiminase family protein [Rhodanobacter sp.]
MNASPYPRESPLWNAVTRAVSSSLGLCELSHIPREPIDVARARRQHRDYVRALQSVGCHVQSLPEESELPDSVFVEDVAIVLDEVAVLTRPGASSRRPEVASVADLLRHHRPLRSIEAPATLDGGDVLRVGRTLHVGQSARSNPDGIMQLRELLIPYGYAVKGVPVRDCLHLKSAVTALSDDTVLLQPAWVDRACFADLRVIEVDPAEPHAANVLRVGDALIMPASFPRTRGRLLAAGFKVTPVDVSELQKAEGAVTCCSLVFRSDP